MDLFSYILGIGGGDVVDDQAVAAAAHSTHSTQHSTVKGRRILLLHGWRTRYAVCSVYSAAAC